VEGMAPIADWEDGTAGRQVGAGEATDEWHQLAGGAGRAAGGCGRATAAGGRAWARRPMGGGGAGDSSRWAAVGMERVGRGGGVRN
jgi:hypothetical protein